MAASYDFFSSNNLYKLNILISISIIFIFYIKIKKLEVCITDLKNEFLLNKEKFIREENKQDKDLIGLSYPNINYDGLQNQLFNRNIKQIFSDFLKQLENKLIYLEKEINVTKLSSFHYIRSSFLKNYNITYKDENISELHNIINWEVIHKSNQLKGIASDKYLGCKYANIKLGINLCQQRIRTYDTVEEIDFNEISKKGNIVLKITNGCHDLVFFRKNKINTKEDIEKLKDKVKYYFQRDFGLIVPEFFHLYSKKRIIEEIIFEPYKELSEFKIFVVNREIKFILHYFSYNNRIYKNIYDCNYKIFNVSQLLDFNIFSTYGENILNKLKYYAIKLSEDFKNFIRVDLYVFKKKIYLSELTFDSYHGLPYYGKEPFVIDAAKNYTKYE